MTWVKTNRRTVIVSTSIAAALVAGWIAFALFGRDMLSAAADGSSGLAKIPAVSSYIETHDTATLEALYRKGAAVFGRMVLTVLVCYALLMTLLWRYPTLLRDFFTSPSSPINLALFRIGFYAALISSVDLDLARSFAALPESLKMAPIGLGALTSLLPVSPTIVSIVGTVLIAACVLALVGLFTRFSSIVALAALLYVAAIPNLYGKVNHEHHLIWFAALLCVSRCSDMLSIDAAIRSWRRADTGDTAPPGPSSVYTMPLAFVFLLFGVLYFFPGVWKFVARGPEWFVSDNLQLLLYHRWIETGIPALRLDQHVLFYGGMGLATVVIEAGFIYTMLFPRVRPIAALGGFSFHFGVGALMGIWFTSLMKLYFVFFNWGAILPRIGRWMFASEVSVLYDGSCKLCRRTISSLRRFDVLDRVCYIDALNGDALNAAGYGNLDEAALMRDMHLVTTDGRVYKGYAAYQLLAARIPILWPLWPLMYVWPVTTIGRRIYRRVADSRMCTIKSAPTGAAGPAPSFSTRPLIIVGTTLLVVNSLFGFTRGVQAWPFACYPTFSSMTTPYQSKLTLEVLDEHGTQINVDREALVSKFGFARFRGLLMQILKQQDEAVRERELQALWSVWVDEVDELERAGSVRFYEDRRDVRLEAWPRNPIERRLLYSLELTRM